jgi:hypothetical protein
VSRATSDKYVATPHGTFLLKYFFTTAIAATSGEPSHSAEAIRQRIKRMIERENPSEVLSDDQIVAELKGKGVVIARRTVAKYRESLGIASSVERRRAKALGAEPARWRPVPRHAAPGHAVAARLATVDGRAGCLPDAGPACLGPPGLP